MYTLSPKMALGTFCNRLSSRLDWAIDHVRAQDCHSRVGAFAADNAHVYNQSVLEQYF